MGLFKSKIGSTIKKLIDLCQDDPKLFDISKLAQQCMETWEKHVIDDFFTPSFQLYQQLRKQSDEQSKKSNTVSPKKSEKSPQQIKEKVIISSSSSSNQILPNKAKASLVLSELARIIENVK